MCRHVGEREERHTHTMNYYIHDTRNILLTRKDKYPQLVIYLNSRYAHASRPGPPMYANCSRILFLSSSPLHGIHRPLFLCFSLSFPLSFSFSSTRCLSLSRRSSSSSGHPRVCADPRQECAVCQMLRARLSTMRIVKTSGEAPGWNTVN